MIEEHTDLIITIRNTGESCIMFFQFMDRKEAAVLTLHLVSEA